MICAAVSGPMAISTCTATTRLIHTSIGMRANVMPGHRQQKMVLMRLTAVPIEPTPLTSSDSVQ